jgi:hypothetical protein
MQFWFVEAVQNTEIFTVLSDRNNFVANGSYKIKCKHMFMPTYRPQTYRHMFMQTVLFVICRSCTKCGFTAIKEGITKWQKETEDRKLRKVRVERRGSGKRGPQTTEDVRLLWETFILRLFRRGRKGSFMAECLKSKLHKF